MVYPCLVSFRNLAVSQSDTLTAVRPASHPRSLHTLPWDLCTHFYYPIPSPHVFSRSGSLALIQPLLRNLFPPKHDTITQRKKRCGHFISLICAVLHRLDKCSLQVVVVCWEDVPLVHGFAVDGVEVHRIGGGWILPFPAATCLRYRQVYTKRMMSSFESQAAWFLSCMKVTLSCFVGNHRYLSSSKEAATGVWPVSKGLYDT